MRTLSSSKKYPVHRFIIAALLLISASSGFLFFREWRQYREAQKEYESLGRFISAAGNDSESRSDTSGDSLTESGVADVGGPSQGSGTDTGRRSAEKSSGSPASADLRIDFQSLKSINPDFAGVLHIPALDLIYPVVHSKDNTEYLTTTFSGDKNSAGAIFLDMASPADFTGRNSFIFGHNMRNGTMFGSLKRFLREPGLAEENPYFYIYTESGTLKYMIFSYFRTAPDSPVYSGEVSDSSHDRYVTLSTCYGTDGAENFVVQGYLTE